MFLRKSLVSQRERMKVTTEITRFKNDAEEYLYIATHLVWFVSTTIVVTVACAFWPMYLQLVQSPLFVWGFILSTLSALAIPYLTKTYNFLGGEHLIKYWILYISSVFVTATTTSLVVS